MLVRQLIPAQMADVSVRLSRTAAAVTARLIVMMVTPEHPMDAKTEHASTSTHLLQRPAQALRMAAQPMIWPQPLRYVGLLRVSAI